MDEYGTPGDLFTDFFSAAKDFTETLVTQAAEMIKPLTPLQKNLKEALGPQQYGCSTQVLGELTRALGYGGDQTDEVSEALQKALELPPYHSKNLVRVLTLIEFMVGHGSPFVLDEIRRLEYLIRKVATYGVGSNGSELRCKADNIMACLGDEEHLEQYRIECAEKCSKFVGISSTGILAGGSNWEPPPSSGHWPHAAYPSHNYDAQRKTYAPKNRHLVLDHAHQRGTDDMTFSTGAIHQTPYPVMDPSLSIGEDHLPPQLNSSMFAPPPSHHPNLNRLDCTNKVGRYSLEEDTSDGPFGERHDNYRSRYHDESYSGHETNTSVEVFGGGAYKPREQTKGRRWFGSQDSTNGNPFEEDVGPTPAREKKHSPSKTSSPRSKKKRESTSPKKSTKVPPTDPFQESVPEEDASVYDKPTHRRKDPKAPRSPPSKRASPMKAPINLLSDDVSGKTVVPPLMEDPMAADDDPFIMTSLTPTSHCDEPILSERENNEERQTSSYSRDEEASDPGSEDSQSSTPRTSSKAPVVNLLD